MQRRFGRKTVTDFRTAVVSSSSGSTALLELLDPEDEDTAILINVDNYLPVGTV
jgi:hypothetical protein